MRAAAQRKCQSAHSSRGETHLYAASQNGHADVVKILLDHMRSIDEASTSVNLRSYFNRTIIFLASDSGHVEIVKILLEYNANVDLSDNDGWTPLCIAAFNGNARVVEL